MLELLRTNRSGWVLISCCVLLIYVTSPIGAFAAEIRTYSFVPGDEFTYFADCGECFLTFGTRAKVAGQFTVSLDFLSNTGVLESLEATLVNVETSIAQIGGNPEWVSQPDRAFLPDNEFYDRFRPPLSGDLELVGQEEILTSSSGVNSGDVLLTPINIKPSFQLRMSSGQANLDFALPIIDSASRITNAAAVQILIVPEPSTLFLMIATLAMPVRKQRFW